MKNWKILISVLALILVAGLMVGVYFATRETPPSDPVGEQTTQPPQEPAGSKKITVTVVHKDGSKKDFVCQTDEKFLGPVLVKEKIVEDNQEGFGLYIKVADGERADYTLDQAYWAVFIGDQEAMTGADEIPVKDGDTFKLVYTGA